MAATSTDDPDKLSTRRREELRLGRRCFDTLERFLEAAESYPPGHPVVDEALDNTEDAFDSLFRHTDQMVVRLEDHRTCLLGTEESVWETSRPEDYCFALSRDGVFLLYFLGGLQRREIRKFGLVLRRLDQEEVDVDATAALYDADFTHLEFRALDGSMAWLAGLNADALRQDSEEERREVRELFGRLSDADAGLREPDGDALTADELFRTQLKTRSERRRELQNGTEQMLNLRPSLQDALGELKQGLLTVDEFESRYGEILAGVLARNPNEELVSRVASEIADVMVRLVEGDEPSEALTFLKAVHTWRGAFEDEAARALQTALRDHLSDDRIRSLVDEVADAKPAVRRPILRLLDALDSEEGSRQVLGLLEWELGDETERDIYRFLQKRASSGLGFAGDALDSLPDDEAERVVDIACEAMPETRSFLVDSLPRDIGEELKVRALEALEDHWRDSREIRQYVLPLLNARTSELRTAATRAVEKGAPDQVRSVLQAKLEDEAFYERPKPEIEAVVTALAREGGEKGLEAIEEAIRCRLYAGSSRREFASKAVRSLVKVPTPRVADLLESVSDDWMVPGSVRSACDEVLQVIG
ncbi:MAG: hypothetical protein ABEL76_04710 [Bradymonadaceae bacterium]